MIEVNVKEVNVLRGEPVPLGATWTGAGVNFAIFASAAELVELCVFDTTGQHEYGRIALPGRTAGVWHGFLPSPVGVPGLSYGYRVHGPYEPARGLRHNPAKLLIDPYARALVGTLQWHDALFGFQGAETDDQPNLLDSAAYIPKSVVIDSGFDWQGDRPPAIPWRDSIVYELHVKGFTQLHPTVPAALRGKYLGLAHPDVIGYLKDLGVTAVELLPVQAFVSERFLVDKGLKNYWGYNSLAWSAPAREYAIDDPVVEFKTMVRALHAANIEVILDVVYNHTAEGNEHGPTLSLRGCDNAAYYWLDQHNPRCYLNRSGCGNTVAISHAAVQQTILDSLVYWVQEMHVDGFRFDLAPVLGRDKGHFRTEGAFFHMLSTEPVLRYTKLIAEPWDVGAEGYQLGHFPSGWSEWNDSYRDAVRFFWRGQDNGLGNFAKRFAGSSDLFRSRGRRPTASVNYLTCHDGFTLADTVSYNNKHNEANLEGGQDGHNHNLSWNCGVEGPTTDGAVMHLRQQHIRNMLATLLLSQGVPMLQAGDELGRTQAGNNNAYCQDNATTWINWSLLQEHKDLFTFVQQLINLRRQSPGLRRDTFLKGARGHDREHKDVSWRHPAGHELTVADWHNDQSRAIAILISHAFLDLSGAAHGHFYFLCNASAQPVEFVLPQTHREVEWHVIFDTSLGTTLVNGAATISERYLLQAHTAALLTDGLYDRRLQARNP